MIWDVIYLSLQNLLHRGSLIFWIDSKGATTATAAAAAPVIEVTSGW